MSPELTEVADRAIGEYEDVGYTIFRRVIDDDLLGETNGHVEWLQEQHPDVPPERLGTEFVRDDPFWLRLVSDPRLLNIAELFIGPYSFIRLPLYFEASEVGKTGTVASRRLVLAIGADGCCQFMARG